MRNKGRGQGLSIIKLLIIGGLILLVCLGVCIFMVSLLQKSYQTEISENFQEHHESAGEIIDATVTNMSIIVEAAALTLGNEEFAYSKKEIFSVIKAYSSYDGFSELLYVDTNGYYYRNNSYDLVSGISEDQQKLYKKIGDNEGKYIGFEELDGVEATKELVMAYPVMRNQTIVGYFIADADITDLFSLSAFNYQKEMGTCFLIDKKGNIILRSHDDKIISREEYDFQDGIMDYSGGKEIAKQELLYAISEMGKGNKGFVTIKTKANDSMQISYCPLETINNIYLVSCYNDNLVDDRVQPLIFRSVLSCIAIVTLMVGVILFVWSSAKNANLTIEKLAYEDPITKGRNLNYFKEFATKVMGVYKETPFVIYRFDILNFRYINEAYGHQRADEILKSCIRNFGEIFAENELCVRMNSDQFLAILVNDQHVNQKINQYHGRVNQDARSIGIKYPIRFKTGIYQSKKHEKNIDIMIDHANAARKSLSGDEKDMTAIYSDRIVTNMQKLNRIESDMQRALATEEFKVYLQPKWDIVNDQICGAEALVRWIKPDGSMVYPDEFIPVFENNGFVEKLDFYMLEMVCQQLRMLIDVGRAVYPVSVNQSRLLLHSPDYVTNVQKILKKYNIPENLIELEITETVFLDDRSNMIETMNNLKNYGVRLDMDDFGSGYSSLNMLKDVPFDVIKIDREFFSESVSNEASQWILQKIVEMINGLGMQVICEGVETAEQIEFLKNIGCNKVQGYYYSKPIPANEFITKYCVVK